MRPNPGEAAERQGRAKHARRAALPFRGFPQVETGGGNLVLQEAKRRKRTWPLFGPWYFRLINAASSRPRMHREIGGGEVLSCTLVNT